MTASLIHRCLAFEFPATQEPAWAPKVDRWYQLDAFAYGLNQVCSSFLSKENPPSLILLASPEASNETDRLFASSGATSPSKFVHTLPNVRASSLCQVMNWHGPVLCVQKDPETITTTLSEAARLRSEQWPRPWVLSVISKGGGCYQAHVFAPCDPAVKARYQMNPDGLVLHPAIAQNMQDSYLIKWLEAPSSAAFGLPGGCELRLIHEKDTA